MTGRDRLSTRAQCASCARARRATDGPCSAAGEDARPRGAAVRRCSALGATRANAPSSNGAREGRTPVQRPAEQRRDHRRRRALRRSLARLRHADDRGGAGRHEARRHQAGGAARPRHESVSANALPLGVRAKALGRAPLLDESRLRRRLRDSAPERTQMRWKRYTSVDTSGTAGREASAGLSSQPAAGLAPPKRLIAACSRAELPPDQESTSAPPTKQANDGALCGAEAKVGQSRGNEVLRACNCCSAAESVP